MKFAELLGTNPTDERFMKNMDKFKEGTAKLINMRDVEKCIEALIKKMKNIY